MAKAEPPNRAPTPGAPSRPDEPSRPGAPAPNEPVGERPRETGSASQSGADEPPTAAKPNHANGAGPKGGPENGSPDADQSPKTEKVPGKSSPEPVPAGNGDVPSPGRIEGVTAEDRKALKEKADRAEEEHPAIDERQMRMVIVRNLLFRRGDRVILRDINLDVTYGALLAVMGMSGCGKSTLLKLIGGLEKPDQGQIIIGGNNIAEMSERELNRQRQNMGFVFQDAALFDYMNVYENVAFGLRRHTSLKEDEIKQRVADKLALVGLEGTEALLPSELSGGMQKRVGLARAIAADPAPKILLYDEPTAGLDPIMTAVINDLILRVRDELEVTSIVVTHDMGSLKLADQVAMIHNGIIEALGSPADLMATSNPVVEQFIHGHAEGPIDVGNVSADL